MCNKSKKIKIIMINDSVEPIFIIVLLRNPYDGNKVEYVYPQCFWLFLLTYNPESSVLVTSELHYFLREFISYLQTV